MRILKPLSAAADALLHVQEVDGRSWRYLPLVLALAFAVRAATALSGDFILHPDEIMQYLEPAHRLVFGNGVVAWEFFYGGRSWLVPGLVAGVLKLFDLVGLGQPSWYVSGVKLVFCAISLAIPAGMYFFARRHFSEMSARVALLAGAFWYELVGFAHKPMTEFVSSALLLALLALCVQPAPDKSRTIWIAAFLAVLAVAVRFQYGPLALFLLGLIFLRTGMKWQLVLAATGFFLAVGVFDMVTWNLAAGSFGEASWQRGLFHSYLVNIRLNLALDEFVLTDHPGWQYLLWMLYAGAGVTLLGAAAALREPRRYGLLLILCVLVVLLHSVQTHKEYRFIFVVVPLLLLIGSDLAIRLVSVANRRRLLAGTVAAAFTAVSSAGIMEALPNQKWCYLGIWTRPPEPLGLIGGRPPLFAAYRYLAELQGVAALVQADGSYFSTPGYYYLHHKIPFYARETLGMAGQDLPTFAKTVSHVITHTGPGINLPGYSVVQTFGNLRLWARDDNTVPVRRWQGYSPVIDSDFGQLLRRIDPDAPVFPPNWNIRFAGEAPADSVR